MLRQNLKQLQEAQKLEKKCNDYIKQCKNQLDQLKLNYSGRSGRYMLEDTEKMKHLGNEISRAQRGLLPNDNTLLQFFSADGSNMWVDAYGDKFIGFICYEFGQPGHYTTSRPYYLHNGGWKWFYLDSYTKRRFERDEYNFNFKVLKELTPKECLFKYRTFFTENIEAGNRMIAFSIPSDTPTEEYHGQVQLNYRAAGAKSGRLLHTKKLRNRGRSFNPKKGTVDVDMYNNVD